MAASHLGILTLKNWNARYLMKPSFCSYLLTFGYLIIFVIVAKIAGVFFCDSVVVLQLFLNHMFMFLAETSSQSPAQGLKM